MKTTACQWMCLVSVDRHWSAVCGATISDLVTTPLFVQDFIHLIYKYKITHKGYCNKINKNNNFVQ